MEKFDKQIDDLLNKMNDENISKEEQIEYLKKFSNIINAQKEDLDNSFIVGTFISGCGFGIMSNSNNLADFYLSLGILSTGIIISLVAPLTKDELPKLKKKKM